MPKFGPVLLILGVILLVLAVALLVPLAVEVARGSDGWTYFAAAAVAPTFLGAICVIGWRRSEVRMGLREAYLLTCLAWTVVPLIAALPFVWSEPRLSVVDALFEAVSGMTTTGSTVITGLDGLPPGILLWRSMLQWLGGIGIVVMAIAVLPLLRVGGMQLMRRESSDMSEKILARPRDIALGLLAVYVGLTLACALALSEFGMTGFEAINHAMTTISTGGYSTSDGSLGGFGPGAQWTTIVFMLLGATPFLIYVRWLAGAVGYVPARQIHALLLVAGVAGAALAWTAWDGGEAPADAIRHGLFNAVSVITTTGFASTDYQTWGPLAVALVLVLTFCGGCTGSTSGGIKIFRWQILFRELRVTVKEMARPHRVMVHSYDGRPVEPEAVQGILAFVVLTGVITALGMLALSATGLDLLTSLSAAATAVANVGPALGPVAGPSGSFATFDDPAKLVMVLLMLLGRLELLTVLVLMDPDFWRA